MGHLGVVEMRAHAPLDATLHWHLTSNHFPPLSIKLIPVAKRAIAKANRGEWHARVRLPMGCSYQGKQLAPVSACVQAWHLDAFIDHDDDGTVQS